MASLRKVSTTDAIHNFTQQCYSALNSKEDLISVFLDFSKALDTIRYDIRIKNEMSRISSILLSLFK